MKVEEYRCDCCDKVIERMNQHEEISLPFVKQTNDGIVIKAKKVDLCIDCAKAIVQAYFQEAEDKAHRGRIALLYLAEDEP